jgi:hypothetical protein
MSAMREAYERMKAGDVRGVNELLRMARDPSLGMASAVAVSFLYLEEKLDLRDHLSLSEFGMCTLMMLCEQYGDPIAELTATAVLRDDKFKWQTRMRALRYLVALNGAKPYSEEIKRLRLEFDRGILYEDSGPTPHPSYRDPQMAELELLGLEMIRPEDGT